MQNQIQDKQEVYSGAYDISGFIGRRAVLRKIFSRIGAARPQSVSIVGDYKIGKTWMLKYIAHPEVQKQYLSNPDEYFFLYIPNDSRKSTLDGFVDLLCKSTAGAIRTEYNHRSTGDSYAWLRKTAEEITQHNQKIILLLDDFNRITQNQAFPLDFFSFLRSLANNYNIAYITTSFLDLQQLCISKDIEESPFFNIFTSITLKAFEGDDFDLFINHYSGNGNINLGRYRRLLSEYSGLFPYLLQQGRILIFELAESADHGSIEENFKKLYPERVKEFFQQIWENMSADQKQVTGLVAGYKKVTASLQYILKDLEHKQIIRRHKNRYTLFSPAFNSYVRQNGDVSVSLLAKWGQWFNMK